LALHGLESPKSLPTHPPPKPKKPKCRPKKNIIKKNQKKLRKHFSINVLKKGDPLLDALIPELFEFPQQ
jgi:hypothetical protein